MNRRRQDPVQNSSPDPNPRRRNRPLLLTSVVILTAWIVFLIVVALQVN